MKDPNLIRKEVIQKLHNGWVVVEGQSQAIREFRQITKPIKSGENQFQVYHYGKSLKPVYLAKKTPAMVKYLQDTNKKFEENSRLLKVKVTRDQNRLLFETIEFTEQSLE